MRSSSVRSRVALGGLALLSSLATTMPCAAEPQAGAVNANANGVEAKRYFLEGKQAYEEGDFRRAAVAFEAAYARKPHHSPLWNAARAWQRAGDDLRSANLLERYLAEAPADAPDRPEATTALTEARKHVGRVQLRVAGTQNARLDGLPFDASTLYVAPGDHVVTGTSAGREVRKTFAIASGEILSVSLDAPAAPRPEATTRARPLPPWTVGVGAAIVVAGIVVTTVSGLSTVDKRDAFLANKTQDRLDDVVAGQTRTNVLIATTAGVALVTAALAAFFVEWNKAAPSKRAMVERP